MTILGIETSCDETAAAVVEEGRVLSNAVFSQVRHHADFGGVVPEIASRMHVEVLPGILKTALKDAGRAWSDIHAVAVTRGPGLASSLLIGVTSAKALTLRLGIPLLAVNHLEGHLYSVFLAGKDAPQAPVPSEVCPLILLLVTGGHTMLVLVRGLGDYVLLGQTLDDAAGEALDKGAKLLGLGYPGGPAMEKAAREGNPAAVQFPVGRQKKPMAGKLDSELCFSFSGLKTALLHRVREAGGPPTGRQLADIAASFQSSVFEALITRLELAMQRFSPRAIACVGGVAKNQLLRSLLDQSAAAHGVPLLLAPMAYCTDNAAMIAGAAWAGCGVEVRSEEMDIDPCLPLVVG